MRSPIDPNDIIIAVLSIIFSLGLLLPTALMIFSARQPWLAKCTYFLRGLGGLLLTSAGGGLLLTGLAWQIFDWGSVTPIVVTNVIFLGLMAALLALWLIRLIYGRRWLASTSRVTATGLGCG